MLFIEPKEIYQYIPLKFQRYASMGEYMLPLFGKMYFGRIKRIIKIFLNLSQRKPKILDVGGGFGIFSVNFKLNFPDSNVILLDYYSKEILRIVKTVINDLLKIKIDYKFDCDIQEPTEFEANTFDLIFALDVIEHLANSDLAIQELYRILKKGGFLFISIPIESKLLILIRKLFNKVIKIDTNPHWNGVFKSETEFYNWLLEKKYNIIWKCKYPFNYLSKSLSYDMFYLIKK